MVLLYSRCQTMSKLWRHRVQLAQKRSAASAFPSHCGRPDPKNLTSTILERDERREEHVATTPRPFCAPDVVVFQVSGDARGVSPALSPSLQSRPGYPTQMSHCRQNQLLTSYFHSAISTTFAKNQSSKVYRLLQ